MATSITEKTKFTYKDYLKTPDDKRYELVEGELLMTPSPATCHEWILKNIPMDKSILREWLEAGYIENNLKYPGTKGTPQGGIISPTIANMALDGLEQAVRDAVPRRNRVNFVRYADDFIVTGKSKRLLEEKVKPAIEEFLKERGLKLSTEKTRVTYIKDGFTFLGQTFRKHGNTLHITPAKEGIQALIKKVGTLIRKHVSAPIECLIKKLNSTLRGWANYHRHVVSSEAFSRVDPMSLTNCGAWLREDIRTSPESG